MALRYTELNPVRAGLAAKAELWKWSSAAVHCGSAERDTYLDMAVWNRRWSFASWQEYLAAGESEAELTTIRQFTHTGRPLGSNEFIHSLQQATLRQLAPQKGGRPTKRAQGSAQKLLAFDL